MGERLSKDERCLGPGLAAYFVKGVLDRGIPMHTGANAQELIGDGERVVGVRATKDGHDLYVKANRGVVIAVSSYERNQDFNKTLGQQLELGSMVFSTIDGANFRLAGPVGARIARVPDITSLGFVIPGEEDEEGKTLWRSALQVIGQPHTIVVNRKGKRFGNEAFYRSFYYTIDIIDGGNQTHPNFPCWVIIDSQVREKYPFAAIMPGQDWPKGLGATADSIAELAGKIGVDARGLEATIASFNIHAEKGEDPDFASRHASLERLDVRRSVPEAEPQPRPAGEAALLCGGVAADGRHAPFPSAGLLADHHCRAIGWDDKPIEGLYVAGNSMARMETGAVMQSGISNARGMTYGYLAGLHAAGKPSDLLKKEIDRLGL